MVQYNSTYSCNIRSEFVNNFGTMAILEEKYITNVKELTILELKCFTSMLCGPM